MKKKYFVIGISLVIVIALLITVALATRGKKQNSTENKTGIVSVAASASKPNANGGNLNSINVISNGNGKKRMEGYEIIGEIEIPKIDLKSNILNEVTKRSIEIAVAKMFSTDDLNQPGTTVIYGHNYRNQQFFSRNDELEVGDKIYITDFIGEEEEKEYEIYNIFRTTMTDTSFYTRNSQDTEGKAEVVLSTCTDDAAETDARLIVQAREI